MESEYTGPTTSADEDATRDEIEQSPDEIGQTSDDGAAESNGEDESGADDGDENEGEQPA